MATDEQCGWEKDLPDTMYYIEFKNGTVMGFSDYESPKRMMKCKDAVKMWVEHKSGQQELNL